MQTEDVRRNFGESVRRVRQVKGWSQRELADRLDIRLDPTAITRIENGTRDVKLAEAHSICSALGITIEDAVSYTPEPIENLRTTVVNLQNVHDLLGIYAQRFMFYQAPLAEQLVEAEAVPAETWVDEGMAREVKGILARARNQLTWTIEGAIESGLMSYGEHPEDA